METATQLLMSVFFHLILSKQETNFLAMGVIGTNCWHNLYHHKPNHFLRRWRQPVPTKRWCRNTRLSDVINQKYKMWIKTKPKYSECTTRYKTNLFNFQFITHNNFPMAMKLLGSAGIKKYKNWLLALRQTHQDAVTFRTLIRGIHIFQTSRSHLKF